MRIAIGSDHAGFALKEVIKSFLTGEHGDVLDVGTNNTEPVDYSDYAEAIGQALRQNRVDRGILLCGSGVGASMAANRMPGIRAGLCHDTYSAHQGVEHDDMNVLVLGGRIVGVELARELIGAFLNARFSGEARHRRRLAKMTALENPVRALEVFGQSVWLDYIRRRDQRVTIAGARFHGHTCQTARAAPSHFRLTKRWGGRFFFSFTRSKRAPPPFCAPARIAPISACPPSAGNRSANQKFVPIPWPKIFRCHFSISVSGTRSPGAGLSTPKHFSVCAKISSGPVREAIPFPSATGAFPSAGRQCAEGLRNPGQQVMEFVLMTRNPLGQKEAEAEFAQLVPKLVRTRPEVRGEAGKSQVTNND